MKSSTRFGAMAVAGLAVAFGLGGVPQLSQVQAAHAPAIKGSVGFLFSDFTTSARWKQDEAYYIAALHRLDPQVQIKVQDAKTDQTRQLNEARSLLTGGAKVLIDVPVDSVGAKAVVAAAHANKPRVPVISYDRLILDAPDDAYTSFNGFQVGVEQAKYLLAHVKAGTTIIEVAGSNTDNNAVLFHNGARSVIDPAVKSGKIKLGYFKYTPNWSETTAQQETASALNKLNNKISGVLVANDGMAGGVIAALKAQHLAGKVVVTGQDATVAGLQQILLGNQSMTVYKPLRKLAAAAAQVTDTFLRGKKFTSSVTQNSGVSKVPSILIPVVTVTKSNIKSTVLKDGFVTKFALCSGIPKSACKGL